MNNNFEKLISSTETTFKAVDPFLVELYKSQEAHQTAIDSGKKVRETFVLYFERTNNEEKGEKILLFLKKLASNLSRALSEVEKEIILLNQNKENLSLKWSVFSTLSQVLSEFPNGSANRIRFEMHSKIPNWEDVLEESTKQILESIENGLEPTTALSSNIKTIMSAFLPKNGKVSPSKLAEIQSLREECEKAKNRISTNLSRVIERANALSEILENAFF